MKKLIILAASVALAACGHQVPDESDISNGLTDLTGNCELIKLSDVKKLNGRDIGNGQYLVQQEFTAELLPIQEFAAATKELLDIKNAFNAIDKKYSALSADLAKEQGDLERKLNQEYNDKRQKVDDKYRGNQSEAYEAEVNALYNWERAEAESIRQQMGPRQAEIGPARSKELAQYQVSKLSTEQDLLIKVRSAYDKKCPGIKGQGKAMVFQLLGDNELEVFANGAKKTLTESNVAYVKTERGWIRSK